MEGRALAEQPFIEDISSRSISKGGGYAKLEYQWQDPRGKERLEMRVRRLIEWLYDTERSEREDCSNTCAVTRGRRNAQPSISRTRTRPTAVVLTTLVQAFPIYDQPPIHHPLSSLCSTVCARSRARTFAPTWGRGQAACHGPRLRGPDHKGDS